MEDGQFCPVAKATQILGEKWTLLILREWLMGGSRFNVLQRGHEYFPTPSCKEPLPILRQISDWGMRWPRQNLTDSVYDVELLMLYLQRSVVPENLIGHPTVVRFTFTDIADMSDRWLSVVNEDVDIRVGDPGKDVDVCFATRVRTVPEQAWGPRKGPGALKLLMAAIHQT